jgi:hypothetical protein
LNPLISLKTEQLLKAKLERAEQHIHDLQDKWTTFRNDAYGVAFKDDESTGQRVHYLARAWDPDNSFSLIIGDAVHDLRSALDHLAYHVMSVSPGVNDKQLKKTGFPIAENSGKYQTELRPRIVGMRADAVQAIDDIEPYGGGAGEIFWHLHSLDIIDKHKLLIAVGCTNRRHSMTPQQIDALKRNFLGMDLDAYTPAQDAVVFQTESANIQFPLKTGDILAVTPKSEVNRHMDFTFEIAFGEPEVIKGHPVIPTLHQMAQRILDIIRRFIYCGMVE